jgi:Mrp family chromosome partitioning ATPase
MTNEEQQKPDEAGQVPQENRIVRLIKTVVENPERGRTIDERVVQFRYFNSFNYSLLAREGKSVNLTVGITSAKAGEGKTLVASNLAVSLAMGFQKKTVLIDLCFAKPRIHEIFGLQNGPGLADAFTNGSIHVSRTQVENLYVLTSGMVPLYHEPAGPGQGGSGMQVSPKPLLGLDQLTGFRDVIYSLEQEFDFIIVDMPSVNSAEIPILFTNTLNGLLIVVDNGKTRREELDAMFQKINEHQVLGFVFNRIEE